METNDFKNIYAYDYEYTSDTNNLKITLYICDPEPVKRKFLTGHLAGKYENLIVYKQEIPAFYDRLILNEFNLHSFKYKQADYVFTGYSLPTTKEKIHSFIKDVIIPYKLLPIAEYPYKRYAGFLRTDGEPYEDAIEKRDKLIAKLEHIDNLRNYINTDQYCL